MNGCVQKTALIHIKISSALRRRLASLLEIFEWINDRALTPLQCRMEDARAIATVATMNFSWAAIRKKTPQFSLRTLVIAALFAGGGIQCGFIFLGPAWVQTRSFNSSETTIKFSDGQLGMAGPILSPDGTRLALVDGPDVIICNTDTGEEVIKLAGAAPFGGEFSPDNTRLITFCDGSRPYLWNALNGDKIAELGVNLSNHFSLDSKRVVGLSVTTTGPGNANVRDAVSGKLLNEFKYDGYAVTSPRGDRILTSNKDGARLCDSLSGKEMSSMEGVWFSEFDPTGNLVVTIGYGNQGAVWDATTGQKRTALEGNSSRRAVSAFSSDGSRFVMDGDAVTDWDTITGRKLASIHEHDVDDLRFMRDGQSVCIPAASTHHDCIWNPERAQRIDLTTCSDLLSPSSMTPIDDKRIAVVGNGKINIFDFRTGELLTVLPGTQDYHFQLLSSPGGRRMVAMGKAIMIWERRHPEKLAACFSLPEVWVTIAFAGLLIWSVIRDRRVLKQR
jgi:WD40 repeat protein